MSTRPGQQWGNYRLTRLLGRGAFADVYLGQHIRLDRQVAIKILRTSLHDQIVSSFQQEAQVIADLIHPHIVRLLDFAIQDDQPFLVLEYAPSGALSQKHRPGAPLPLSLVVEYTSQVASALYYAHQKKLVHCDVKPANMLIGREGEILLSDFGIATIAHSTSSLPLEHILGTPLYMSPEQIQGHPRAASDQYALGIAAYQWLTGQMPFHGVPAELITQHLSMAPRPLHEYVPQIPTDVEQVILTALAKEPTARFEDVFAFASALQQAVRSLPSREAALSDASSTRLLAPAVSRANASVEGEIPPASRVEEGPAPRHPLHGESPEEPVSSFPTLTREPIVPAGVLLAAADHSPQAGETKRGAARPFRGRAKLAGLTRTRGVFGILLASALLVPLLGAALLLASSASLYSMTGRAHASGPGPFEPGQTAIASHSTPASGANPSTPGATATPGAQTSPTPAAPNSQPASSSIPAAQPASQTPAAAPATTPTPPSRAPSPATPTAQPPSPAPVPDCLQASPASITITQVLGVGASLPNATITLSNCSSTNGQWTAAVLYSSGSGWTSCDPASGRLPANGTQTVHLLAGSSHALLGTYRASWTFYMGNTDATVIVTLVVVA